MPGEQLTRPRLRRRAASLPALLWPGWAIRLIPASKVAHNAVTSIRAGLAALLLIPGTRLTTAQAVDLLGGHIRAAAARATLNHLSDRQRTAAIAILTNLADTLDDGPAPIDYARRRTLFKQSTVDAASYTKMAAANGWRPGSSLQLRLLDDHLNVLLTGTRPDHHTTRIRWGTADAWNPLTLALPSLVRDFVHQQAQHLLHRHRIHEPVTWQPPVPADAHWPGIDPDTISPDQFAAAFAAHAPDRNGLQRICHSTGLSGIQVRLYTQLVSQAMPEQQWDDLAEHVDENILTPATLRYLYHEHTLSMTDIARLAQTTEQAVRNALTAAGITPQPQRQRMRPIPPAWFRQHYLGTGKTVTQAAAEAGVCRNTFAKYARLHNIATSERARPVNPFAGWPTHQQPPANVIAACTGLHGIDYVRQILAMPGHPTRRAAAAALGLDEKVLCDHRQHVEHFAGIRIFQPGRPVTATTEGARFLHQAALALRQLDLATSGRS